MRITEHVDPIHTAETLLNEIFQHLFQQDAARERLGFSRISQVSSPQGFPGWYLWLGDSQGVFHIEIASGPWMAPGTSWMCGPQSPSQQSVPLVLRYFPHVEDPSLDTFSCFEQIFRMGPHFDATGTPTFEGGRTMQESFYVVGQMIVSLGARQNETAWICQAPERWQIYRTAGLTLEDASGVKMELIAPSGRDRDVEGWRLSRHIFDKIVSAYSFLAHRAPSAIGASAGPSAAYLIDELDRVQEISDDKMKTFTLWVSFDQDVDLHVAAGLLTSGSMDLIGLWRLPGVVPKEWQNDEWWSISACHFSDDGFLCPCYQEHHRHRKREDAT